MLEIQQQCIIHPLSQVKNLFSILPELIIGKIVSNLENLGLDRIDIFNVEQVQST